MRFNEIYMYMYIMYMYIIISHYISLYLVIHTCTCISHYISLFIHVHIYLIGWQTTWQKRFFYYSNWGLYYIDYLHVQNIKSIIRVHNAFNKSTLCLSLQWLVTILPHRDRSILKVTHFFVHLPPIVL